MKENFKIEKLYTILSIFGLVLLLLLSPCKVRNSIQAELGIPQTNALNKSQSVISQSNCQTFEFSQVVQTISKSTVEQAYIPIILEGCSFGLILKKNKHSFLLNKSRSTQATDVPYYILYQNLKVYS